MSRKVVQGALFHRPLEVTSSPSPLAEVIPPPIACRPVDSQINWKWLFFSFKGRINRRAFWVSIILSWIVTGVVSYLIYLSLPIILPENVDRTLRMAFGTILLLLPLIFAYTQIAVTTKRLHDTGRSAWLLCWLTVTNLIHFGKLGGIFQSSIFDIINVAIILYFIVVCGFLKGNPDQNKYGEPPK